jgi:hypothetical protein
MARYSPGTFLPGRLAIVLAERDLAVLLLRREQHAPAVFRHAHVIELGPAARIDRIGGAQVDELFLKPSGPMSFHQLR